MKKLILLLLLLIQFFSCSQKVRNIDISSIKIEAIGMHGFLVDHSRLLKIKDGNTVIDKLELYGDAGSGCETYIFENDSAFTLIDCNGEWYSVDKKYGLITSIGWKWKSDLPKNRLGAFVFKKPNNEYELIDTFYMVYRYKDPNNF